jgi:uncharacterized membrane protein YphA (DoxX/SURF4 family)
MTKRNKIIYWIFTIWLALGMLSTGIVQLLKTKDEVDMMTRLGYPVYFLTIIGVWKMLGVVAVLIPKFPLLKEWAYAGFFFAMTGALISHLARGSEAKEEGAQEVRQAEKDDQKDGTRWDGLAIAEENDQGCQSDEDVSDARRIRKDSRDVTTCHLDKKDGSDDPE